MNLRKNFYQSVRPYWLLVVLLLTAPFALYIVAQILPIGDDFSYFTAPYPKSLHDRLFPFGSWWRPFDALLGHYLEMHSQLFPLLNHIIVYSFHLVNTFIVSFLLRSLQRSWTAVNTATLLFYISPAMLGTVFDTDGMNQVASLCFSMLGLMAYLCFTRHCEHKGSYSKEKRYWSLAAWILLTWLATLFKENGITWFVVAPLLVWSLGKTNRRQTVNGVGIGMAAALVYGVVRLSLPRYGTWNEAYALMTPFGFVKSLYKMFSSLLLPIDNICLMYDHNYIATALSLILASPLFVFLMAHAHKKDVRFIAGICLCVFIAMSPHLITQFSNMHVYGATVLMAVFWACLIDNLSHDKTTQRQYYICLLCSLISIVAIDAHHISAKYKSGQKMLKMGNEALTILKKYFVIKPNSNDKIYSISLIDNSYKYSTFCANAGDAFCWGNSVEMLTVNTWPKEWSDTAVIYTPEMKKPLACQSLHRIADMAYAGGYDMVICVSDQGMTVFPRRKVKADDVRR